MRPREVVLQASMRAANTFPPVEAASRTRARSRSDSLGHRDARALLTDTTVDRVFVIGADLGQWATSGWDLKLFNKRINRRKFYFIPQSFLEVEANLFAVNIVFKI